LFELNDAVKSIFEFANKLYEISENYESAREQTEMVIARLNLIANDLVKMKDQLQEKKEIGECNR